MGSTDREVTKCPNGSFCCKDMNTTCCDDGDGLWIDISNYELKNYDPSLTTISSSSATSTSTRTNSISSGSSAVPAGAITTSPSKPSATAKTTPTNIGPLAGGVVGGVAALILVSGLVVFLYRKRRTGNNRRIHEVSAYTKNTMSGSERAEKDGTELVEMDGNELRTRNSELEGTPLTKRPEEEYYAPEQYKSQIAGKSASANNDTFK